MKKKERMKRNERIRMWRASEKENKDWNEEKESERYEQEKKKEIMKCNERIEMKKKKWKK